MAWIKGLRPCKPTFLALLSITKSMVEIQKAAKANSVSESPKLSGPTQA